MSPRLRRLPRAIWSWLGKIKFTLVSIVAVSVALVLVALFETEPSIRIIGLFYQIVGMVLAILSLVAIRNHFDERRKLRERFLEWVEHWRQSLEGYTQSTTSQDEIVVGDKLTGTIAENPEVPDEVRIERIDERLRDVADEQKHQAKEIASMRAIHEAHETSTAQLIDKLKDEFQSDFKAAHLDGFPQSLISLGLLTVGTLLSTLAHEIACFLAPYKGHRGAIKLRRGHRLFAIVRPAEG